MCQWVQTLINRMIRTCLLACNVILTLSLNIDTCSLKSTDRHSSTEIVTHMSLVMRNRFLAHLSRRLMGELINGRAGVCPSICPSVHTFVVIMFPQMFLIGSFSYLWVTMTCMRAWMSLKFGRIRPWTTELAALEGMKKIPWTYNGENDVITFFPLFLIESFSYLQLMRTCIRAWISSKFGQMQPPLSMATDRVII